MPISIAAIPKEELIAYTKGSAGSRIISRLPEWKQRNLTARSSELLKIRHDRAWTTEEQAEVDANQAEWDWVKQVRVASNQIETDVNDGLITTEGEIDTDTRWPA